MRTTPDNRRRREGGQVLAIAAVAMISLLGMTGLIVDGGNAWSQQRLTQNATDAASEAGAVVLAQRMGGSTKTDADVLAAVTASVTTNAITLQNAYYTDYQGNLLTSGGTVTTVPANAAVVGAGTIPANTQGVQARGAKSFNTYLTGIVGITSLGVGASATTVAGRLTGVGAGDLLPVTFPVAVTTCDGQNKSLAPGDALWPIVARDTATTANESIVPLCQNGPGAVGWLDFGCGNLAFQISNPCNVAFDIPTWIQTTPGNPNNVDSEMNAYDGQIITFPLFDGTCKTSPPGTLLGDCTTGPGVGNNTYYHIPAFVGFLLDHAYIQGNNHPACNQAPGQPPAGGNGATGCLKGWFVRITLQGPVGQGAGNYSAGGIGVQLIK